MDIKKPKEFENRVLRSEKPQKKFTAPRRFIQNTVTHYNYHFNASRKLTDVINRAKEQFRDDYSQLLPFYNYSLDVTMADSMELDSVSFKAQTGIVLHDLRNDWADNMYLLWGQSYYLQQKFDSASLMFQFINYAFAPREDDDYYSTIGSARDGNKATSISTKEKKGLLRKALTEPPSRNDAFIWQIRTFLQRDLYAEAASLILALQNDSLFPSRLHDDLEQMQAYYFYRQNNWDSAAVHLEGALGSAENKQERARWEFLLGQLYERTGKFEQSASYYENAIGRTTDPILEVYARLALVRVNRDEKENTVDNNIATLLKMAKRDKYVDYRDIIYYMAAQMEIERGNWEAAIPLLEKSTKYIANNSSQRNKAFLQLAELSFRQRQYRQSLNYYDSLQLDDPELLDPESITTRKTVLGDIVFNLDVLHRQDSLQQLAALPEDDRRDYVKNYCVACAVRKD
ncbi:MAG: tetratricopeptide repeat protein [Chitinophagaceae bacterium]|nr:tetratricopeptide repeat protein [Chitinophagaceae bacterium]